MVDSEQRPRKLTFVIRNVRFRPEADIFAIQLGRDGRDVDASEYPFAAVICHIHQAVSGDFA